jgi:hypothetical protein
MTCSDDRDGTWEVVAKIEQTSNKKHHNSGKSLSAEILRVDKIKVPIIPI